MSGKDTYDCQRSDLVDSERWSPKKRSTHSSGAGVCFPSTLREFLLQGDPRRVSVTGYLQPPTCGIEATETSLLVKLCTRRNVNRFASLRLGRERVSSRDDESCGTSSKEGKRQS